MKTILSILTLTIATLGLANTSKAAANDPLLDSYVAVSEALAKDDLAAAKKAATTLAETANADKQDALAEHAGMIASSDSLDAAPIQNG